MAGKSPCLDDLFDFVVDVLTEAVVNTFNKDVTELMDKCIGYLEKMKEGQKKDITEDFINAAFKMKLQVEIALSAFKGGRIYLVRENLKVGKIAGAMPYFKKHFWERKKSYDRIDIVVDMKQAKERQNIPLRHEFAHAIVMIQRMFKRKDPKKPITWQPKDEVDYLTGLYEVDQVVSRFVSLYKEGTTFATYDYFIKNLYKEYKPTQRVIDQLVSNKSLKKYLYKRIAREGLNLQKIIRS